MKLIRMEDVNNYTKFKFKKFLKNEKLRTICTSKIITHI